MCLKTLDAVYQQRAVPPGSARYLSWLFAAPEMRAPLLGVYALQAEWGALMNPVTDRSVAQLKLAWWQDEMRRLGEGSAVHPICRYLASLPSANGVDFSALGTTVAATCVEVSGSPIERSAELEQHAAALWAGPLLVAAQYAPVAGVEVSARTYAVGEYLSNAMSGFALQHRFGRVPFAIDELLAAGIDDEDLAQPDRSDRLRTYLRQLRTRGAECFAAAVRALPTTAQAQQRHIPVLCALGWQRLREYGAPRQSRGWQDMLLAWKTARRPHALRLRELPS